MKTGKKTTLLAATAALSMAIAAPSFAAAPAVIYENGESNRAGGTEMSNTMLAQDFRLTDPASFTSAFFFAVGLDDAIYTLATLKYAIFADNGGAPGSVLASGPALNTNVTATDATPLGGQEYQVSFDFDGRFDASADTVYWLGLQFVGDGDPMNIYWSTANFNDTALGMEHFDWGWSTNTQEHSFSLVDNGAVSAVPEPGAWALMIVGFGLAGAALRQRRAGLPATTAG